MCMIVCEKDIETESGESERLQQLKQLRHYSTIRHFGTCEWASAVRCSMKGAHKTATVNELLMGINPKQRDGAETNVHWHEF